MVKQEDLPTKARHERDNEDLDAVVTKRLKIKAGNWVLEYEKKSTNSGGAEHVLRPREEGRGRGRSLAVSSKLSHNWTGPCKVLVVGLGKASDGRQVGGKLLLLDVNREELGKGITPRVSVHSCKRCFNPHEKEEVPGCLPWDLSKYVLNRYAELAPPFHLTRDDVEEELDRKLLQPLTLSKHRICRGIGGKNAVQCFTQWTGWTVRTWEHEVELEQYGDVVLKY